MKTRFKKFFRSISDHARALRNRFAGREWLKPNGKAKLANAGQPEPVAGTSDRKEGRPIITEHVIGNKSIDIAKAEQPRIDQPKMVPAPIAQPVLGQRYGQSAA